MKLFGYWRSGATYRVRIALNLKGVAYDYRPINLLKDEQKQPFYLQISPQAVVPTLIDGGVRLNQSLAIIEYLDETRPEPPLLPKDPGGRAKARAIALAIACEAQPFGNLRMLNYLKSDLGFDEAQRMAFFERFPGAALRAVEQLVAESAGRFCVGDAPSIADICLAPQLYAARRFKLDLSACPNLLRVDAECAALDAFQKAHPDLQPDAVSS